MWYNTVIAWATQYAQKYPFFKIYKDKVGGNVYGQSSSDQSDGGIAISQITQALSLLQHGHYIIQLRKTLESQAGNMQFEFDAPYSTELAISGIRQNGNNPAAPLTGFMTVEQYQQGIDHAIGNLKKELQAEQKIKELNDEIKKLKKDKDKAPGLSIDGLKGLLGEFRQMYQAINTEGAVARVGFTNDNKVPAGDPAKVKEVAAVQTAPVQEGQEDEWDEIDERTFRAQQVILNLLAKDRDPQKARADLADITEALAGYMIEKPGEFALILPSIMENRKFYKYE